MTIPKEAIEKAIEGGWKRYLGTKVSDISHSNLEHWEVQWEQTALDPAFWQALGKALGWDEHWGAGGGSGRPDWLCHALEFCNLYYQGGIGLEKFWDDLLAHTK